MQQDLKDAITIASNMLDHHDRMKGAYFYNPPKHACDRRSYEKYHSMTIDFEYQGHTYKYISKCECSCHNVYFSDGFYFDGRKTTATKISNALKKMQVEMESIKE